MRNRIFTFAAIGVLLAATGTHAQTSTPIVEKQVLVQGSIGQVGREIAFLNIQNLEQAEVMVTVQFVRPAFAGTTLRTYTLQPEERLSVNVGAEVPELGPAAFFSVVATASAADDQPVAYAYDLTWHRASDFQEVESRTAVV